MKAKEKCIWRNTALYCNAVSRGTATGGCQTAEGQTFSLTHCSCSYLCDEKLLLVGICMISRRNAFNGFVVFCSIGSQKGKCTLQSNFKQ